MDQFKEQYREAFPPALATHLDDIKNHTPPGGYDLRAMDRLIDNVEHAIDNHTGTTDELHLVLKKLLYLQRIATIANGMRAVNSDVFPRQ
jgi:hypothetical protein